MSGGTLVKEVITTPFVVSQDVEEEPPSASVTKEVRQPMQGIQPFLFSVPLATQDPETSQPPVSQDP